MAAILNFNPRRFCRLIGWRLARQRHWALQAFLVITVILLIPTLFTSWAFIKNLEQQGGMMDAAAVHAGRDMAISFAVKIIGLCCLMVYPSLYIRDMEEKGGRMAELTLPATAGERFWSRWIVNVLITVVSLAAGIFLSWLVGSGVWYFYDGSTLHLHEILPKSSVMICLLLMVHSFFLLGGTLLCRKAWAWTALTGIILLQVGMRLLKTTAQHGNFDTVYLAEHHFDLLLVAVAVALVVLARWLFGRFQLVHHKWFNL